MDKGQALVGALPGVKRTLTDVSTFPYVDAKELQHIEAEREDLVRCCGERAPGSSLAGSQVRSWTSAGGLRPPRRPR